MTDPVEAPDPDLDDVPRAELGESDPMYPVVARVLDDWLLRCHGAMSSCHYLGTFLELLAADGYRVTAIPTSDIGDLLGPPKE